MRCCGRTENLSLPAKYVLFFNFIFPRKDLDENNCRFIFLLTFFPINTFAADSPPRQKGILRADCLYVRVIFPMSLSGCGWPRYGRNLWDVGSGQPKSTSIAYTEEATLSVACPDGSALASWNCIYECGIGAAQSCPHRAFGEVNSVAFSPDGGLLARSLDMLRLKQPSLQDIQRMF